MEMFNEAQRVIVAHFNKPFGVNLGSAELVEDSVPPIIYCLPEELLKPGRPVPTARLKDGRQISVGTYKFLSPDDTSRRKLCEGSYDEFLTHRYARQLGLEISRDGLISDLPFNSYNADLQMLLQMDPFYINMSLCQPNRLLRL